MDSISAIHQQPQLGSLAKFLRMLEQEKPEFLPSQLNVMGAIRALALPQSSTVENLSYGNLPFTMPPQGTGAMIPQVKTGRKAEVADLIGMIGGVPGVRAVGDVATKVSNEAADKLVRMITGNPQATAPGVIQETAMPFMNAVVPKAPQIQQAPQKSDLGFYSALEQATIPLQNKGTGQQYLAQIEKTAGVKPEEIKWTGLDEFLRNRETVTKPEIQQFLDQNRVNLQEVRLDNRARELFDKARFDMESKFDEMDSLLPKDISDLNYYNLRDFWARGAALGNPEDIQKIQSLNLSPEAQSSILAYGKAANESAIAKRSLDAGETTKFSSYTLPGGENYREILLTMPSQEQRVAKTIGAARLSPEEGDRFRELETIFRRGEANQSQIDELGRLEQRVQESQNAFAAARTQDGQKDFISSHFDQPNILAHMRVNDRVVDGKKTLFIEEIQSDWHQAGRKKGYATGEKAELPEGTKVFEPGAADSPGQTNQAFTVQIPRSVNGRSLFYGTTREEALANAQSFIAQPSLGAVPDAPFKTTWHELSLKRAIQEASEKGYDKIAFTTGQTQAARYDLSKQVDYIDYVKEGADNYRLAVVGKNGQAIDLPKETFTAAELENYVGKDVAQRIVKGEGQTGGGRTTLRGPDLQVGGEGMKGFYDNILPKSLEKLGKKFDAKVTKTKMDGTEVWQMDITPKMRESVLTKGQPLFQVAPTIPAAGLLEYKER